MSRRREVPERKVDPDPKYGDRLLSKFINMIMMRGQKSTAEKIVYSALDIVAEKTKEDPLNIFKEALDNIKPSVEVKSRRVGGANYQVPIEVRPERRVALAFRWLSENSRARGERTMIQRLAGELLDAAQNRGNAVKKKEETHRMAEANRAFAHYRW